MPGYSGTPLVRKLGIREGFRVGVVNPPAGFEKTLKPLPKNVEFDARLKDPLDLVLLFVNSEKTLKSRFPILAKKLATDGIIWVAWPKKSSGVSTDLSFDNVQKTGLQAGLVDVKICAVSDVWSGLKFVYRLKDRSSR
jgi:hypothetical protein